MAKMFYTLEEASQKLGVSEDEIRQMADDGKLQQFRDRDKLMFKREQVDELFGMSQTQQISGDSPIDLAADSGEITLDDSIDTRASQTDAIDLMAETDRGSVAESPKSATATGISVFDADEVSAADPLAQTQVGGSLIGEDDELTLESVGSGSGLLDLTREADDTSLGAVELLDDLGPGEGSDIALTGSSTGLFNQVGGDSAGDLSGLSQVSAGGGYVIEEVDPPGDGFGGGMMLGVFASMVIIVILGMDAASSKIGPVTDFFTKNPDDLVLYSLLILGLPALLFGVIGYFIGKARAKKIGMY